MLFFMWRALRKAAYLTLGYPMRLYFAARFLLGKVDMPQFEIVLTTKCTLRCEACSNLMQYFDKDTHYTCTPEGIAASLDALLGIIDSVRTVLLLGGEPLLFKDLAQVVGYLQKSPKVKRFQVVTNGTLDFKEDALEALKDARKASVCISNYAASPNLAVPLRQESIIAALKERGIPCYMNDVGGSWVDMGKRYKRGRSKEDVARNFRACMMPCVSVMSGEGAKDSRLAPLGAAFVCATASSLSRLKGLAEFEGDFVDFATATKERIAEFYAQDYFKACDYCHDMWEERSLVAPAVQTRELFRLEADS